MQKYKNDNGKSLVSSYESGADFIKVEFCNTARVLKFSYRSAGQTHVEKMKALAKSGNGLGEYIEKNMRMR